MVFWIFFAVTFVLELLLFGDHTVLLQLVDLIQIESIYGVFLYLVFCGLRNNYQVERVGYSCEQNFKIQFVPFKFIYHVDPIDEFRLECIHYKHDIVLEATECNIWPSMRESLDLLEVDRHDTLRINFNFNLLVKEVLVNLLFIFFTCFFELYDVVVEICVVKVNDGNLL